MADHSSAVEKLLDPVWRWKQCLPAFLLFLNPGTIVPGFAQAPRASAYPVDPVAAAGMTTGLPNGVTSQQAEMMQVRTSAQGAQGEAVAASMARSVDLTIEERNRELALQSAREKKSLKTDIANRLKFEKAAESYNKVSSNEMSTWKTASGGVKVERDVPDAFLMALITEEEQLAARGAEEKEKKRFSLFNKKDEGSSASGSSDSGGGFLSAVWPPRLPGFGRGGGEAEAYAAATASDTSEPSFVQTAAQTQPAPPPAQAQIQAAPVTEGESRAAITQQVSAAQLVDGPAPGSQSGSPGATTVGQTVAAADQTPEPGKKKSGFLSMFKPDESNETSIVPVSNSGGGGGLFGFGKKKPEPAGPMIDAGLFPAGAVSQAPTGSPLQSSSRVAETPAAAPAAASPAAAPAETFASTSSVELPGTTIEKEKRRGLALPPMPTLNKGERSADSVPTLTTVNSAGTSYYTVSSTAQFMVYGENQMQSEIKALPAGTVVLMTKPGEQWASVRLPDGTEGVLQNKNLRPAAAGESGGSFAVSAQ